MNEMTAIATTVSVAELPLVSIEPDPSNVRKIANPEADERLRLSVAERGVDIPILVRPHPERSPGRFVIVYGERRYRAATAAGHATIPAIVREMDDAQARSSQIIENAVRADMHPVDQWRMINAMFEVGYSIKSVSASLGLTEHRIRQLQRMGDIHPDILAEIAKDDDDELRSSTIHAIANAPAEVQLAAFQTHGNDWYRLAEACKVKKIRQQYAIFDAEKSGVVFEQDLFAEPGSADEWTTRDVAGFLKAQEAALQAQVAAAKGRRLIGECDTYGRVGIPKGYQRVHGDIPKRFTKDDARVVFMAIAKGYNWGEVESVMGTPLAARGKHGANGTSTSSHQLDHVELTPPAREAISKAGRDMLAKAKRETVQHKLTQYAAIDDGGSRISDGLLVLLTLAVTASNVSVHGEDASGFAQTSLRDLQARLIDINGNMRDDLEPETIRQLAAEAIGRIVVFDTPNRTTGTSGPVAEWIGNVLHAESDLPRFDTAAFLEHVNGDTLREAAVKASLKSTGTVKALRASLVDHLPDWQPASFGAVGPYAAAAPDHDDLAEDERPGSDDTEDGPDATVED